MIYKVGGTNGTFVPISEISVNLQNAYRAMEDRQFDEHDGISYKALLRAGLSIIKTRSISQGGSTITQQIIKNNLLTQERSLLWGGGCQPVLLWKTGQPADSG